MVSEVYFNFILFSILCYLGLEVARRARDSFNALVAIGSSAFIFAEFVINIAMVLGIFPVVGMPLPFFSYGGSSAITVAIAIGLILAVDKDTRRFEENKI